mmetsp:Transcript_29515/g.86260  ORF Transcript_29515/g.86260 Transcript_29515/m.86260 type:complete len:92 (+) Transcript_29515:988-1263(+)
MYGRYLPMHYVAIHQNIHMSFHIIAQFHMTKQLLQMNNLKHGNQTKIQNHYYMKMTCQYHPYVNYHILVNMAPNLRCYVTLRNLQCVMIVR